MIIISSNRKMKDEKEFADTEQQHHLPKVILLASGRTRF